MRDLLVAAIVGTALAGCATSSPLAPTGEPQRLVLERPVELSYPLGTLTLLPGPYVAEAVSDDGVWYRAERGVLAGNRDNLDHDAGVFIARDGRRWGVWVADAQYMKMRTEPLPPFR